jgi:hypothetical protein
MKYNIEIPSATFIPSITMNKEKINLWDERKDLESDNRQWVFPLSVTGFYDRKYSDYFTEDKLSGRPEFYLDPFYIQSQMGTYFLADENLKHVIMEVVQFPQHKELKKKEETPDEMYQRVYGEIIASPSKYFIGFDRTTKTYGRKFYRREFDLEALKERYKQVAIEIISARWNGNFYKNFKSCNNIFPGVSCDMQAVCKNGNISENMYKIRGK